MAEIKVLLDNLDLLTYPDTMVKVKGEIPGLAFFPGGKGTFDNKFSLTNKNIMVLGQDFDSEKNYETSLQNGCEDIARNPTWRNLIAFLNEIQVSGNNCFFTNAIMGVRKGSNSTGKSPAFKDKVFIKECERFFLRQIEIQKPKVIFALGKYVAEFLSSTSDELTDWSKLKNFAEIDGNNMQIKRNINFKNGIKSNVVILTHPSFRPSNIHRRSYGVYSGHEAEIMMARAVL